MNSRPAALEPAVRLTRVALSVGTLDLLRFTRYDHASPRHAHEEFTIGTFETGNGSLGYRRARWRAYDGSVLAVPPDEVHTAEPLAGKGWTYRAMYPSASLMSTALGHDSTMKMPVFFSRPIHDDPPLARTLSFVHAMLESGAQQLDAESLLVTTLHALVARHGEAVPAAPPDTPVARIVQTARDYLHANYARPVKLASLAALCGSSPFHLVHCFTEVLGIPPHAYLTQIRANRARVLLLSGESLSGVAYRCGFCDQSHLTRTFKRLFGVTPGSYAAI